MEYGSNYILYDRELEAGICYNLQHPNTPSLHPFINSAIH